MKISLVLLMLLVLAACSENQQNSMFFSTSKGVVDSIVAFSISKSDFDKFRFNTINVEESYPEFNIECESSIDVSDESIFVITAPINGRVVKKVSNEGEQVRKGDVLLEIESLEFANILSQLVKSNADLVYLNSELSMSKAQVADQNDNDKMLLMNKKHQAELDYSLAVSKMSTLGISENEIQTYLKQKIPKAIIKIKAEIDGVVSENRIRNGQAVYYLDKICNIINKKMLEAQALVSSQDLAFIDIGDSVIIHSKGNDYYGKIISMTPQLEEENNLYLARIFILSPLGELKLGMKAKSMIKTKSENPVIAIPLSAVSYENDMPYIFVETEDLKYERRIIEVKKISASNAVVSKGLELGEKLVISPIFDIKTLFKQGVK